MADANVAGSLEEVSRRPAPANPTFPLSPGRQDRALELGSRLWGYLKHSPPPTQRQGGLLGQQPQGTQ